MADVVDDVDASTSTSTRRRVHVDASGISDATLLCWRMRAWFLVVGVARATTVGTWNVWNTDGRTTLPPWTERWPSLRAALVDASLDVLTAQEVTPTSHASLRTLFPHHARFEPSDAGTGEGVMVYSTTPVALSLRTALPRGTRDANARRLLVVETAGLRVCTTHLAYDPDDARTQLEWALPRASACDVLTGDLNVYANDPTHLEATWLEYGWVDVEPVAPTCCGATKTNAADRLLRRKRGGSNATVVVAEGSDHALVYSRFATAVPVTEGTAVGPG